MSGAWPRALRPLRAARAVRRPEPPPPGLHHAGELPTGRRRPARSGPRPSPGGCVIIPYTRPRLNSSRRPAMSRTIVLAILSLSLGLVALGARALGARAIEDQAAKTSNAAGAGNVASLSDADRMAAVHQHDRPAATPAATAAPAQPVSAEEAAFGDVKGQPARGYLAPPQTPPPAPPPPAPPALPHSPAPHDPPQSP